MSFIEQLLAMLSFGANWGLLLALELFLAGLGAGAYIVGSSIDLVGRRACRRMAAAGALLSWPMVGAGLVVLIIDLGRPEINRPSHLMNVFNNLSSMMAIGAVLLMSFLVVSLLTTAMWVFRWREGLLRSIIEVVGISLGFGVTLYPGLLLALARGNPFWTSPLLPWLFVVSALCTGLSLVGLTETWLGKTLFPIFSTGTRDALVDFSKTLQIGLLVEFMILIAFTASVWNSTGTSIAIMGTLAPVFWATAIGGLLIPIGIERYSERMLEQTGLKTIATREVLAMISFLLVVLGGLLLRYVILIAGQM